MPGFPGIRDVPGLGRTFPSGAHRVPGSASRRSRTRPGAAPARLPRDRDRTRQLRAEYSPGPHPAAAEHRERMQEFLALGIELVMAPADGRAQRLVARDGLVVRGEETKSVL